MLGCRVGYLKIYTPGTVEEVGSLTIWLDAQDNSTLLNSSGVPVIDNEKVATWKDKLGRNSKNFTQTIDDERPTYRTNIIDNKPSVYFAGNYLTGNTIYNSLKNTYKINSFNFTIIIVVHTLPTCYGPAFCWGYSAGCEQLFMIGHLTNPYGPVYVGKSTSIWENTGGDIDHNQTYILVLRYNDFIFLENYTKTTSRIHLSGVTWTKNFTFPGGTAIGARPERSYLGHIQELLVYDRDLLDNEIGPLVSTLRDKWFE